jgi:uncharacterized BrkB/YihY/UPF0761 family membrane protein
MTDKPLPEDAPILRCVAKKSLQVISKIGIVIGCIAVVLILAYGVYHAVTSDVAMKIWTGLISVSGVIVESVINHFVAIPLGAWVLIGSIVAILTYSYLWCVARRFTDEDWKSKSANESALALVFALVLATLVFAFALVFALVLATLAFAFALATLAVDPVDKITVWYYVFRFGGAWINYRKRMNAAAQIKQE